MLVNFGKEVEPLRCVVDMLAYAIVNFGKGMEPLCCTCTSYAGIRIVVNFGKEVEPLCI